MFPAIARPWTYLSITVIIFSCCYQTVQPTKIKHLATDSPSIDEAYLTFTNVNVSIPITLTYNQIICERCDFQTFSSNTPINTAYKKIIDTRFAYEFQVLSSDDYKRSLCPNWTYQFSEHGNYTIAVTQDENNKTYCNVYDDGSSSAYYTPIIVGVALLVCFVVILQSIHLFKNSERFQRARLLIGHGQKNIQETNIETMDTMHDSNVIDASMHGRLITPAVSLGNAKPSGKSRSKKRLHSLDTFRGFSLMIMIFVNYGGGGYWFFDHSTWNGLTLADLVFPWFVWMMGASIVLSQRSLRAKKISKISILIKIARRTFILFLLGLLLQGGDLVPEQVRILGVLQRLAICYFITAVIVLIFSGPDVQPNPTAYGFGETIEPTLLRELYQCIFSFWLQWSCVILIVLTWLLVTLIPSFENCPAGYLGPGGRHEHGKYVNCTGGMAGYIDRIILGPSHLYGSPTCKDIYNTLIPYDPEGILGNLTGTLLCYLGAQAGHIFANGTKTSRICGQWIGFGIICGAIGLILSKGGQSDSWIPINKNLWSLSFVLVLASLAFFILTVFYIVVDIKKWFNGEPWIWLGMNSIVVYVGHEICGDRFPVQFDLGNTHVKRLAINAYGVTIWMIVAGIMYYKKCFIAI